MEDLVLIENSTESLVRDIYLFMTYTGLSYMDTFNLKERDIIISESGNRIIEKPRGKTNLTSIIPLMDKAERIIERFRNHPASLYSGTIFPHKSNYPMNRTLKKLHLKQILVNLLPVILHVILTRLYA